MFESAALNLLTGALIAGIVGVVTAFAVRLIDDRFRRRTVAQAIFTEMIQALNHFSAAVKHLDKITQYRDPKSHTLSPEMVRRMRPLDRKILPSVGEAVGYLSPSALNNAIAFEGTMESESRGMLEAKFDTSDSRITVQEFRNRICLALAIVADNAEAVADDAYRWRQNMHEANRRVIDEARQLAETADPTPEGDRATATVFR